MSVIRPSMVGLAYWLSDDLQRDSKARYLLGILLQIQAVRGVATQRSFDARRLTAGDIFNRADASINQLSGSRRADAWDLLDCKRRVVPDTTAEAADQHQTIPDPDRIASGNLAVHNAPYQPTSVLKDDALLLHKLGLVLFMLSEDVDSSENCLNYQGDLLSAHGEIILEWKPDRW